MGCDYSTNLKDIVVKEGRLFKFCKVRVGGVVCPTGQRKRMDLQEVDVGGHKTIIMIWDKILGEGATDMAFLRRFYSEVTAVIIDIDTCKELKQSTVDQIQDEFDLMAKMVGSNIPPVYIFAHTQFNTNLGMQQQNLIKIDDLCNSNNWNRYMMDESDKESIKIKLMANELYTRGISPKKMRSGKIKLIRTRSIV